MNDKNGALMAPTTPVAANEAPAGEAEPLTKPAPESKLARLPYSFVPKTNDHPSIEPVSIVHFSIKLPKILSVNAVPQSIVPSVAPKATPVAETTGDTIKSPIIGTFYRKPSPEKPNFVEVGDHVNEGDTLCVIEAMKLFNEIEAEVSGTIVKILVEDSTPVEFEQPLFIIDPA